MIDFCPTVNISEENRAFILKSLPEEWETEILNFQEEKHKELHIKINAKTITDTQNWLKSYQKLTNTFYSVNSAYTSKGQRVHYKKRYHCHHNTRHKDTYDSLIRNSIKNTKCPSSLIIVIRRILKKYQGRNLPADPNKPCEIKIKLHHNHSLDSLDILKFKKVLPEVKEQLLRLFDKGYTVSKALKHLKESIKQKHQNYNEIFADRSRCPDYSYCYYLHLKHSLTFIEIDDDYLSNIFNKYNEETNDISAEFAVCEQGYVVCVCPPITKRIHQLEVSSEIIFVDTFTLSETSENNIYLLFTLSEIGCLPLGVILTSSKCLSMVRIGFSLLKDILEDAAFHRNENGPNIFVTDEFLTQDNILSSIWPKSKCFLNIFHVLQNIWRWLSDINNKIASDDKPLLFKDFYNVLYAKTEKSFEIAFNLAKQNAEKYANYLNLLNDYFSKKEFWAVYAFPDILTNNNDSIKFSESTIRFLREKLLHEMKNLNFIEAIKYIMYGFYPMYEQRLTEIVSLNTPDLYFKKLTQCPEEILKQIKVFGANMRLVPSQKHIGTYYVINTDLLTCTCANANSFSLCKHVQCVCVILYAKQFKDNCQKFEVRQKCNFILTGDELLNNSSYKESENGTVICNNLDLNEETFQTLDDDLLHYTEISNVSNSANEQNEISNSNVIYDNHNDHNYQENVENNNVNNETARSDECVKECKDLWQKVTNIFETFIDESADELSPVINKIANKFEIVNNVSDMRSAFNIFDSKAKNHDIKNRVNKKINFLDVNEIIVQKNKL